MSLTESREESTREEGNGEAKRLSYNGTWGGNGDTATSQTGRQGAMSPFNCSLLMLTCLVWQLASVFLAQLDHEAALRSHNSGIKAQRIKCCVTLRKRNSVTIRACARVCACACMRTYKCICVGSALFLCIC